MTFKGIFRGGVLLKVGQIWQVLMPNKYTEHFAITSICLADPSDPKSFTFVRGVPVTDNDGGREAAGYKGWYQARVFGKRDKASYQMQKWLEGPIIIENLISCEAVLDGIGVFARLIATIRENHIPDDQAVIDEFYNRFAPIFDLAWRKEIEDV